MNTKPKGKPSSILSFAIAAAFLFGALVDMPATAQAAVVSHDTSICLESETQILDKMNETDTDADEDVTSEVRDSKVKTRGFKWGSKGSPLEARVFLLAAGLNALSQWVVHGTNAPESAYHQFLAQRERLRGVDAARHRQDDGRTESLISNALFKSNPSVKLGAFPLRETRNPFYPMVPRLFSSDFILHSNSLLHSESRDSSTRVKPFKTACVIEARFFLAQKSAGPGMIFFTGHDAEPVLRMGAAQIMRN